ncbi:helix-turn-helix domain-containing protein [Sphaerisporangium krabiense]|uniref:Transcriptional regulator with XRE-family HTH domain n=1 Tax=Sphaerisporangium krabiense TaxID=763782 RepID=A0A7W8Z3X9_9ACTN|nr:helix-turn-helix transcriptional regulator [Sphaerisporangium krabiense]MBB5626960.1 transcriptional regulator with XRE-family HTH domain [Sphaerisporangium krabiense]
MLKVIRESIGLTQESLAEQLMIDVTKIQGWESGRRPLMAVSVSNYLSLRHSLLRLGVGYRLLAELDNALEADRLIGYVLSVEPKKDDLQKHPLACWVITRPFTDLVAWPFTKTAPMPVAERIRSIGRRGPVSVAPFLPSDERAQFFERLKMAAELADVDKISGMLLRRQAHYVAAFDDGCDTAEWVAGMQRAEECRIARVRDWTPSWAVVRSGAHTMARLGDRTVLQHFIRTRLADDVCESANLNYWAYWLGEVGEQQPADTFMVEMRLNAWRGVTLLRHLIGKLYSENPYVDVVIHTLWALIMLRPSTLDLQAATELNQAAGRVLDEAVVSPQSQREITEIMYVLRVIDSN